VRFQPQSFYLLTYPFLFDPTTFEQRRSAIDAAVWSTEKKTLTLWKGDSFGEEDLLPYVQRYLNPPPDVPATVLVWNMTADAMQSPEGLGTKASWTLHTPNRDIRFEIKAVKTLLFRVGVGFLSFQVRPLSDNEEEWIDLMHFGRYADRKDRVTLKLERKTGKDQVSPFFPPSAGGIAEHPEGQGTMMQVIRGILMAGETTASPWWREVYVTGQCVPYAALFVDTIDDPGVRVLLFRMRHFFGTQQIIRPAEADLDPDHSSLFPYSEGQWFVFSLDGSAFVAANPPDTPFMTVTMPHHLRDRYYLLFLMVLHQRFALMELSERVAGEWLHGDAIARAAAFGNIRDSLLEFTARGFFSQVMQTEHHHTIYRKWQDKFQVELLYREVSDEVKEMHGALLLQRTDELQKLAQEQRKHDEEEEKQRQEQEKRMETWFGRLTFLLGGPALALTFVQTVAAVGFMTTIGWFSGALFLGTLAILLRSRMSK
jgi:hypothetical protein